MILAPLQKLPKHVGDLGKFIVAKGIKKVPKVQKIAQSGHTGRSGQTMIVTYYAEPHPNANNVSTCGGLGPNHIRKFDTYYPNKIRVNLLCKRLLYLW